jgi:hypothetical protein
MLEAAQQLVYSTRGSQLIAGKNQGGFDSDSDL